MKKNLIVLIVLTIIALPLSAQRTKDALYLKNGSIIYGKLLEISDSKYRIQTSDGGLFNFASDEVDRFLKESPRFDGRKTSGVGFAIEAGILIGSQASEFDAPFSFNIIGNYTTGTKNILGLGSGVEFMGSAFTPVFFEYKRLFNERKTAPFIFFRGGTLLHTGGDDESDPYNSYNYPRDYKGGASFAIGTGISWAKEDMETYLSFAYRYAQTSYKQKNYNDVIYTYKNNYNRLEVKFGFKF
jgi:hypothetical protein